MIGENFPRTVRGAPTEEGSKDGPEWTSACADPAFFTVEGLATYLDVPVRTVQKWAMAKRVPGMVRAGRLLRFQRAEVMRRLLAGNLLLDAPARARSRKG